ncbi:RICIN domain-containing protein [Dactylosporangium sp. CA-152071]|uniref:RICIN domain-containing protein n=1 Tax=Dactylosporangium sp. CA-152071 TaxID=3239933 RepID=UPI003D8A9230
MARVPPPSNPGNERYITGVHPAPDIVPACPTGSGELAPLVIVLWIVQQAMPSRRLLAALVAIVTIAVSAVAFQSPAQAYRGANILRNWATGRCLDSNRNGDVYTLPRDLPVGSNDHQMWEPVLVAKAESHIVIFRNRATGRCLVRLSPGPNVVATTRQCGFDGFARDIRTLWSVRGKSWENVVLYNQYGGEALDGTYVGHVHPHAFNDGGFQHWKSGC